VRNSSVENLQNVDLVIIGGGCAGMSAAISAHKNGIRDILILERSSYLGGVLKQCIHNGFGIHRFGQDLTGSEYAKRYTDEIDRLGISFLTDTFVLSLTQDHDITAISPAGGILRIRAKAVILAMGCRERPRGALTIPGTRPAGIFSAGTAQRYLNLEGYIVGKKIVILGSGDIGLIMAREFAIEGSEVLAVAEIMPYSSGLIRNIVQCLEDFHIPLYYNTTVTRIEGTERVTGVWLSQVDASRKPVPGTERFVACDTLVLSVGLIPENELCSEAGIELSSDTGGAVVDDSFQTSVPGVFACGNALHVHDLVDFVSMESEVAGERAAQFIRGKSDTASVVRAEPGFGVMALVPQRVRLTGAEDRIKFQFRPRQRFENAEIRITSDGCRISSVKKRVLTPGEMCELSLERSSIHSDLKVEVIGL